MLENGRTFLCSLMGMVDVRLAFSLLNTLLAILLMYDVFFIVF